MIKSLRLCLAILTFLWLSPVNAQGHDHAPPNGGQIRKIGTYEAELVLKGREVSLFVTNHLEEKVDGSKFSATMSVLMPDNQQKVIELTPMGENRLGAHIDFSLAARIRAVVTLRMSNSEIGKGRYSMGTAQ